MNFDVDLKMLKEGRKPHRPVEAGYFHDDMLEGIFYISKAEERRRSAVHTKSCLCRLSLAVWPLVRRLTDCFSIYSSGLRTFLNKGPYFNDQKACGPHI
jgi:hypothetical protein